MTPGRAGDALLALARGVELLLHCLDTSTEAKTEGDRRNANACLWGDGAFVQVFVRSGFLVAMVCVCLLIMKNLPVF